jgi:hypothetical protein
MPRFSMYSLMAAKTHDARACARMCRLIVASIGVTAPLIQRQRGPAGRLLIHRSVEREQKRLQRERRKEEAARERKRKQRDEAIATAMAALDEAKRIHHPT